MTGTTCAVSVTRKTLIPSRLTLPASTMPPRRKVTHWCFLRHNFATVEAKNTRFCLNWGEHQRDSDADHLRPRIRQDVLLNGHPDAPSLAQGCSAAAAQQDDSPSTSTRRRNHSSSTQKPRPPSVDERSPRVPDHDFGSFTANIPHQWRVAFPFRHHRSVHGASPRRRTAQTQTSW